MLYKDIVNANFSKSAVSYDYHATVQKKCGQMLIEEIGDRPFRRILEIGCGTGTYTQMLKNTYKDAFITAVDISDDMINVAKNKFFDEQISFLSNDGEQLKFKDRFDLITSNASLQWFEDLGGTFEFFNDILAENGMVCFSMYGPETFRELKEVLSVHYGARKWLTSSRFISLERTKSFLERHFGSFELKEEHLEVEFLSLWDFLSNIKHSGTRGQGLGKSFFLGKYAIREMERTYIEKFGGITATHHVFFCKVGG
ncbi:MAG: malonyl-ACP O-methyltransferase BioC [Candidatus Omnitrophota bacterium]